MTTAKLSLIPLLILMAFLISNCHLVSNKTPSILVVAVDNLGVNELSCSAESQAQTQSGIALMCQESIRFTHAYTTSVLSGPAMASILTGQYPLQHGLKDNRRSFLPSRVSTLAESALQKGYATAFFSGGAPVLRKLNLHQGFEIFDDSWTPTPTNLFKPFSKNQVSFESWIKDIGSQSFFSVFYVPDLVHVQTPTQTLLGEARNLSFESQLEEFDESLMNLIQFLKSRRLWDSTLVVLVGLNGADSQLHLKELLNTNLYSERTQVGLLIKPPQKPRDSGINWSFDDNVTIADLGKTIRDTVLGSQEVVNTTDVDPRDFDVSLPRYDLSPVFKNPSTEFPDRPILIETSWAESLSTRYAFRFGQYLFIYDSEPRAYNSLIDKAELSPIKMYDISTRPLSEKITRISEHYRLQPWPGISKEEFLKWDGLADVWSTRFSPLPVVSTIERLAHRLKDDQEVSEIYNRELLRQSNWPELKKWSQGMGFKDLERIANKNLKITAKGTFQEPCLRSLELANPRPDDLKQCSDPAAFSLLEWQLSEKRELSESSRENARRKFLRLYQYQELDQKIAEANWALEGVWDISLELRGRPPVVEMMLALPEMQKYRLAAQKAQQQRY